MNFLSIEYFAAVEMCIRDRLTHTNLFNTIARMLRTGAVPFVLSCVVYVAAAVVEWLCASGGSGFGAASAAATAGSARAAVSTNASSIIEGR